MRSLALLLLFVAAVAAFECPSDTILRLASNHREKDVEAECHREKTSNLCSEQGKVDKLWKEFEGIEQEYKKLVASCVKARRGLKVRRDADHDPNDPNIDHTGHGHRRRRHEDHDPNDPDIDHSGHNHGRKRRHEDHDPNDPNIDHSGHSHRRRRHEDHDPTDPNIDHSGHNHRRRRHDHGDHDPNDPDIDHSGHEHRRRRHDHENHDPNDPDIDHTGHEHRVKRHDHDDHDPEDPNIDHTGHHHNHRRRRNGDHDPNDPNVDHTGHNHRRRRHDDHDPNDPNVDHSGHNHKRRRHAVNIDFVVNRAPYSEPERQQKVNRARRQVCKTKASEGLMKLHNEFKEHCDRENICLPDEDLPEGAQRDKIKDVQAQRAKKYSAYLAEVSYCNA